jgi:hypothetical protein
MSLLTIDSVRERFPNWRIKWDYGRYEAVHDNFEADWKGEEDGYVGNGLNTESRDLEGLVLEIEAIEEEHNL